ncbi:hypothetical protein CHS0354_031035 [Potamilus streckersoni]|uniref:Tyrosinase copper-binding domain-containing protein n=1 Tax=Potamilus streckersoni TaxID=2493646 RepID=A0AAE0TCX2_9BIVA|nr:hypothetical protein CHS0354_031035 [Potamilus streckersoni]
MSPITLLAFISVWPFLVSADIKYMPWPENLIACLDAFHKMTDITEEVGENIFKHCIEGHNISNNKLTWNWVNNTGVDDLPGVKHQVTNPVTSPPSGYRTRKEYRTLTDKERNRFHEALNAMRRAGEFQRFANYHKNMPGRNVLLEFNNGPVFLAWHRVYLARPHCYVGGNTGDMSTLQNAAFDPAFWLHHAYIDYIWELFRIRQRTACNVDPTQDYPNTVPFQSPNSLMWGNELSAYRNIDGFADYWTRNWYGYQPTPTCSSSNPDCGSMYLRCDTTRNTCVSRSASEMSTSTGERRKRHSMVPVSDVNVIYDNAYTPTQNVFCVDGVCDTKLWVYIPVQIVHIRPKGYTFTSFPITAGQLDTSFDIYHTPNESYLYNYSQPGNPKEYQQCHKYESGAKPIFVTSHGLSYYGTFTDYAIVDGRLPVQSSVVYIGVKKPNGTTTEVFLSARDICGCVCKPQCLVQNSSPPVYKPCSGAIELTDSRTNMYAWTIYEATMMDWEISFGSIRSKKPDIAIVFTCTFGNEWPWINSQSTLNEGQK